MAFNLIVPVVKPKASFRIATVRRGGGGPWKLQISMPSAQFVVLFGDAARFDILIGDGQDKGKIMLKPNPTGHFKPTMMKHTAIFLIADIPDVPEINLTYDDPERREVPGGGLMITLPSWMETWRDVAKARGQVIRERELEKLKGGR
ncbi:hypothetical protein G6L46_10325 [Agrobacterium rhizogenes]|uniref:hypothetical protein n=1 Tax=Rhizobium rhizogenes TaxID=359 RepID=UPI0015739C47|nr:hypothetical protein [Rhizobium rhizogenes]NTF87520.1 hypothetical protein [Rhizobium rhizogenes]